jgi:hypothetical protein
MRIFIARGPAALAVFAFIPSLAAAQELTVVQKISTDKNPPVVVTGYIGTDKVRWASAESNEILADASAGKFTIIDHKKREYSVVTLQDLEAAAAEMQARMKEMEEKTKNMPPAMREKLAGLMGGAAASVDVQKGAGTRTIAGYTCQNWVVTMGNFSRTESCVTTDVALSTKAWDSFQAFSSRLRTVAGPMSKMIDQLQEKMKPMNGLPLASTTTTSVLGKSTSSTTEVTEVKKGPVPPSAWEMPAGYKLVQSPMAALGKRK